MGDMVGTRVEVEITGVAHGGIFIARHEGRVLFVSDAMVGERVVAEITEAHKKSFWRADTIEVLEPADSRREHVWAEASVDRAPADRPGGAEFGHIELAAQRKLKATVIRESMQRMAGLDIEVTVEPVQAGDDDGGGPDVAGVGWRTRTRLQVASDGTPGPYSARSHSVVPVSDLPLAVRQARAVAPLDERFAGHDWVDIIVPSTGNPFVTPGRAQRRQRPHRIVERVGERDFALDVHGFWQVHRHAPATLTAAVQQAIDPEAFDERAANLDLYGGVGLLAAAVGDRFGAGVHITTVESDPRATGYAAGNLSDWAGASAVTSRVDRYLSHGVDQWTDAERARVRAGTVVLDPPRAGAGAGVVSALASLDPAQIVYVACDPVALARDVGLFREHGWNVSAFRAFDLFPHTHHVEVVAALKRGH